jgi:hypothetical protein
VHENRIKKTADETVKGICGTMPSVISLNIYETFRQAELLPYDHEMPSMVIYSHVYF